MDRHPPDVAQDPTVTVSVSDGNRGYPALPVGDVGEAVADPRAHRESLDVRHLRLKGHGGEEFHPSMVYVGRGVDAI